MRIGSSRLTSLRRAIFGRPCATDQPSEAHAQLLDTSTRTRPRRATSHELLGHADVETVSYTRGLSRFAARPVPMPIDIVGLGEKTVPVMSVRVGAGAAKPLSAKKLRPRSGIARRKDMREKSKLGDYRNSSKGDVVTSWPLYAIRVPQRRHMNRRGPSCSRRTISLGLLLRSRFKRELTCPACGAAIASHNRPVIVGVYVLATGAIYGAVYAALLSRSLLPIILFVVAVVCGDLGAGLVSPLHLRTPGAGAHGQRS